MSEKFKNIVIGSVLLVFLFFINTHFFVLNKVFATGINNLAVSFSNSITAQSGSITLSFEVENAIPSNGKIEIEFPENFSNLKFTNGTGTNLGDFPIFGTGGTITTLEIRLGNGGTSTGTAVTASGFNLTNPAEDGFYLIQVRTYDATDTILAMGFQLVKIGVPINIKSKVEESLVVSLDAGTKIFLPDPAINGGQVVDQVSTLSVQTNANTSYLLIGELMNNKLMAGTGAEILSHSGSDDYFRVGKIELNLESGTGTIVPDGTTFYGATSLFGKDSGISTNGDLISVHYDLNVSYYKAVGNYSGGIVYSVYPTF